MPGRRTKSPHIKLINLRESLANVSNNVLLQKFLGKRTSDRLLKDAILVTVYRNWLQHPPYTLTELGITTYDRRQVNGGQDIFPGPHAQDHLEHMWFMHLRLRSAAHLPNTAGDPDCFHFGTSAFVTEDQARNMLEQIWKQPMDERDPQCGLRPIIYLSFGDNDSLNKLRNDLEFDPTQIDTTVAVLDAQNMAIRAGITNSKFPSLDYILEQFNISTYHIGNSGNAAAYTTISAFLSALRQDLYLAANNPRFKPGQFGQSSSKTALSVVDRLMERPTPLPPFGIAMYCWRCGSTGHSFGDCPNTEFVCSKCAKSNQSWRKENAATHIEGLCIFH